MTVELPVLVNTMSHEKLTWVIETMVGVVSVQVSPLLHMPSPQRTGHAPQSLGQLVQVSPLLHAPSPQRAIGTSGGGGHIDAQSARQLSQVSPSLHVPSPQLAVGASTPTGTSVDTTTSFIATGTSLPAGTSLATGTSLPSGTSLPTLTTSVALPTSPLGITPGPMPPRGAPHADMLNTTAHRPKTTLMKHHHREREKGRTAVCQPTATLRVMVGTA